MITIIALVLFLFCIARLRYYIKKKERRNTQLYALWKQAQDNRHRWLTDHPFETTPLRCPEYEKLFLIEIGVESLLNIEFPHTYPISWSEYKIACSQQQPGDR